MLRKNRRQKRRNDITEEDKGQRRCFGASGSPLNFSGSACLVAYIDGSLLETVLFEHQKHGAAGVSERHWWFGAPAGLMRPQLILPYSSSSDPKCWLQSVRKREQSVGDAALNNGNSFSGFEPIPWVKGNEALQHRCLCQWWYPGGRLSPEKVAAEHLWLHEKRRVDDAFADTFSPEF